MCSVQLAKIFFLHINTDKTKVMVFRKGGFLGKHEKWHLDGKNIEVVNEYTYLGYIFTTKMSLTKGVMFWQQKENVLV